MKPSIWCSEELLGDLAGDGHVLVGQLGQVAGIPLLVGHLVGGLQTVGRGLVRSRRCGTNPGSA